MVAQTRISFLTETIGPDNPNLGDYKAYDQITLGVGGLVLPNQPGSRDSGFTHEFYIDSFDSSAHILKAAWQDTVYGDCHYQLGAGKADINSMPFPTATYSEGAVSAELRGAAGNPLLPSPPIDWDAHITLSEPTPADLRVSGTITHDCFPAHEISVGVTDVYQFSPTSGDFGTVSFCLYGNGQVNALISKDIVISPY